MSYAVRETKPRHGFRYHPLYSRWLGMVQRCNDPNHVRYAMYGGKGVMVCERWRDFPNFLEDMGMPEPGMSLERLDNNGDYCPENCVWATASQQTRNKSCNRNITFNGETKCLQDWATAIGLSFSALNERLSKWTLERALTTPKLSNKGTRK